MKFRIHTFTHLEFVDNIEIKIMSQTWEQKRELYLTLGTHHYQKPIQLPVCEAVLETAINRRSDANNFVEPVQPFSYVFCERLIYINGLPSAKKGFEIIDKIKLSLLRTI